jgi:hypothetical protein
LEVHLGQFRRLTDIHIPLVFRADRELLLSGPLEMRSRKQADLH